MFDGQAPVDFDPTVKPGGYCWWYVDAISDDGRHALTIIAFIGSVFSPYYAWRRRRGAADPADHCAVNVALYGRRGHRWALTERGRRSLTRDRDHLAIGPSTLTRRDDCVVLRLDEVTAPLPSRIRGEVRVYPGSLTTRSFVLDTAGEHRWWPMSPQARIEVALERPSLSWSGEAYFDTNAGDGALEDAFRSWNWSRAHTAPQRTAVLYDVLRRDGSELALALRADGRGGLEDIESPEPVGLPRTFWGVDRCTRADRPGAARVRQTLEDSPFYSRSLLDSKLLGTDVNAVVHESLSLERFRQGWVQMLVPFRMPRALR